MKMLITLFISTLTISFSNGVPPSEIKPSSSNYRAWIEYIRPSEKEAKWQNISWRNKLMPAVEEAKKLNRPILLWAMNGNPCGET